MTDLATGLSEEQLGKVREALKPFADFATELSDECPDNITLGIYAGGGMHFGPNGGTTVGSLRAARAALDILDAARAQGPRQDGEFVAAVERMTTHADVLAWLPKHSLTKKDQKYLADLRLILSATGRSPVSASPVPTLPEVGETARDHDHSAEKATPKSAAPEGVYVASRASVPERGQMWRALRASGVAITSTWIDEDGEGQTACNRDLWARIDREIAASHALILYVEPGDFPLKGALVEVGMAIARGVPVKVVAPNVELAPKSLRPLGSWAMHPLVSFADTVEAALADGEGRVPSSTEDASQASVRNPNPSSLNKGEGR